MFQIQLADAITSVRRDLRREASDVKPMPAADVVRRHSLHEHGAIPQLVLGRHAFTLGTKALRAADPRVLAPGRYTYNQFLFSVAIKPVSRHQAGRCRRAHQSRPARTPSLRRPAGFPPLPPTRALDSGVPHRHVVLAKGSAASRSTARARHVQLEPARVQIGIGPPTTRMSSGPLARDAQTL